MYWQSSSLQRTNSGLFPSSEVRRRSAMVTVSETTSQRNGLEGGRLTEFSPLPAFSHASRGRPARDRIPSLLCGIGLPSEAGHARNGPQFAEKLTAGRRSTRSSFPKELTLNLPRAIEQKGRPSAGISQPGSTGRSAGPSRSARPRAPSARAGPRCRGGSGGRVSGRQSGFGQRPEPLPSTISHRTLLLGRLSPSPYLSSNVPNPLESLPTAPTRTRRRPRPERAIARRPIPPPLSSQVAYFSFGHCRTSVKISPSSFLEHIEGPSERWKLLRPCETVAVRAGYVQEDSDQRI